MSNNHQNYISEGQRANETDMGSKEAWKKKKKTKQGAKGQGGQKSDKFVRQQTTESESTDLFTFEDMRNPSHESWDTLSNESRSRRNQQYRMESVVEPNLSPSMIDSFQDQIMQTEKGHQNEILQTQGNSIGEVENQLYLDNPEEKEVIT